MNLSIRLLSSFALCILLLFGSCEHATEPKLFDYHNRILFNSARDSGETQLFMMYPDGSDVHQLTRGPHYHGFGTWSYDASKIVLNSQEIITTGGTMLYVMNSNGTGLRSLQVSGRIGFMSPDGGQIAFDEVPNGEAGGRNSYIYLINTDGTNLVQLSPVASFFLQEITSGWSPDGLSILFNSTIDHPDSVYDDEYTMRIDTKEVKRLTTEYGKIHGGARYSPDGSLIAFGSSEYLKIMNKDGSNVREVIKDHGFRAWSPDGSQLLIVSYNNGRWKNFIINADGTGLHQILADDNTALVTDWSR